MANRFSPHCPTSAYQYNAKRSKDYPGAFGPLCGDDPHTIYSHYVLVPRSKFSHFVLRLSHTYVYLLQMSATIDSEVFCAFFQGAPFLTVPGRSFPVADYFLEDLLDATNHIIEEGSRCAIRSQRGKSDTAELWVTGRGGERHRKVVSLEDEIHTEVTSDEFADYSMSTRRSMERVDESVMNYDLIEDVLSLLLLDTTKNDSIVLPDSADNASVTKGSVLVFLPGMGEIRSLLERLRGSRHFGDRSRFDIILMHSSLSPKEQRRAFIKPKAGCQKIILATNICETSITIPDVVCGE